MWTIWKVGNNVYQRYISGDTKVIGRSPTDQGREEAKVQQTEAADTKSPGRDRSPSVEFKPKAEEDHEDFQDVKTEAGDPAVEDSGDTPDASTAILASIALKDPLTVGGDNRAGAYERLFGFPPPPGDTCMGKSGSQSSAVPSRLKTLATRIGQKSEGRRYTDSTSGPRDNSESKRTVTAVIWPKNQLHGTAEYTVRVIDPCECHRESRADDFTLKKDVIKALRPAYELYQRPTTIGLSTAHHTQLLEQSIWKAVTSSPSSPIPSGTDFTVKYRENEDEGRTYMRQLIDGTATPGTDGQKLDIPDCTWLKLI